MEQRTKRSRSAAEAPVRKRSRHLEGVKEIDPRDNDLLRKFVTEQGKIMPSRIIGSSAKQQRQIKRGIRRAREMGILA